MRWRSIHVGLSKQLANRSVEERIYEKICERIVDIRVPRIVEQVIEVSQISSRSRILKSTARQILDVLVPEMAQQLVETPKTFSRDRIQQRTVERIVDIPVPKVGEELVEVSKVFSQDRDQQRCVEETIETPGISLAEKIVEVAVIQTQGKTQQGANMHFQHVVDTVEVEKHIIQEKTNQMTKHIDVPRMQNVEKTVEGAQLQRSRWSRSRRILYSIRVQLLIWRDKHISQDPA